MLEAGSLVWCITSADNRVPFVAATLVEVRNSNGTAIVKESGSRKEFCVPLRNVFPAVRKAEHAIVANLALLTKVNDATVLHCVQQRYSSGNHFTWAGPQLLVAANPWQAPRYPFFSVEAALTFTVDASLRAPSVNEILSSAFRSVFNDKSPSIIVSGVQGSGKTETCKMISATLCSIADPVVGALIEHYNVIVEAMCHCTTRTGVNSSRVCRLTDYTFNEDHTLAGASIQLHNPETDRVNDFASGERCFHIFYYLVNSNSPIALKALGEFTIADFDLLVKGELALDENDQLSFDRVLESLAAVGCSNTVVVHIVNQLTAILHLGNVAFVMDSVQHCVRIDNSSAASVESIARLLSVDLFALQKALLTSETRLSDCNASRDALARHLYSSLLFILEDMLMSPSISKRHLLVLDEAGFERDSSGSFDQLCSNLVSERIQSLFKTHYFDNQVRFFADKGIPLEQVPLPNNHDFFDFVTSPERGLFHTLESANDSSDEAFVEDVLLLDQEEHFVCGIQVEGVESCARSFTLHHHQGDVTYDATGFVANNRSLSVAQPLIEVLRSSSNPFLSAQQPSIPFASPQHLRTRSACEQLTRLSTQIAKGADECFFITCIRPARRPEESRQADARYMLNQLRFSRIVAAASFSASSFSASYSQLALYKKQSKKSEENPSAQKLHKFCHVLLTTLQMELGKDFELVTGQVYVRASGTHVLERLLNRRQPGSSLPASPARRASAAPMSSITGTPPAPPPSRVRAGPSLSLPGLAASQPVDGAPSPFTPVASMSREELLASMKKSARAATNPDVDLWDNSTATPTHSQSTAQRSRKSGDSDSKRAREERIAAERLHQESLRMERSRIEASGEDRALTSVSEVTPTRKTSRTSITSDAQSLRTLSALFSERPGPPPPAPPSRTPQKKISTKSKMTRTPTKLFAINVDSFDSLDSSSPSTARPLDSAPRDTFLMHKSDPVATLPREQLFRSPSGSAQSLTMTTRSPIASPPQINRHRRDSRAPTESAAAASTSIDDDLIIVEEKRTLSMDPGELETTVAEKGDASPVAHARAAPSSASTGKFGGSGPNLNELEQSFQAASRTTSRLIDNDTNSTEEKIRLLRQELEKEREERQASQKHSFVLEWQLQSERAALQRIQVFERGQRKRDSAANSLQSSSQAQQVIGGDGPLASSHDTDKLRSQLDEAELARNQMEHQRDVAMLQREKLRETLQAELLEERERSSALTQLVQEMRNARNASRSMNASVASPNPTDESRLVKVRAALARLRPRRQVTGDKAERRRLCAGCKIARQPLLYAAERTHEECLLALLNMKEPQLDQSDREGTALHRVARSGSQLLARMLIDAHVPLGHVDSEGRTALHTAAIAGHVHVLRVLLKTGPNLEARDGGGRTALDLAANARHVPCVEVLGRAGADLMGGGLVTSPIHRATEMGSCAVVQALIKAGCSPDAEDRDGLRPLHVAARAGHVSLIRLLVDTFRVNVNVSSVKAGTPLVVAARAGRYCALEALISRGADCAATDPAGFTALHFVSQQGRDDCVRLIGVHDTNMDRQIETAAQTALHLAAAEQKANTVEQLLLLGASPNAVDVRHNTALHYAAVNGDVATIKALVSSDVDATLLNSSGDAAADLAYKGDFDEAGALLEAAERLRGYDRPRKLKKKKKKAKKTVSGEKASSSSSSRKGKHALTKDVSNVSEESATAKGRRQQVKDIVDMFGSIDGPFEAASAAMVPAPTDRKRKKKAGTGSSVALASAVGSVGTLSAESTAGPAGAWTEDATALKRQKVRKAPAGGAGGGGRRRFAQGSDAPELLDGPGTFLADEDEAGASMPRPKLSKPMARAPVTLVELDHEPSMGVEVKKKKKKKKVKETPVLENATAEIARETVPSTTDSAIAPSASASASGRATPDVEEGTTAIRKKARKTAARTSSSVSQQSGDSGVVVKEKKRRVVSRAATDATGAKPPRTKKPVKALPSATTNGVKTTLKADQSLTPPGSPTMLNTTLSLTFANVLSCIDSM